MFVVFWTCIHTYVSVATWWLHELYKNRRLFPPFSRQIYAKCSVPTRLSEATYFSITGKMNLSCEEYHFEGLSIRSLCIFLELNETPLSSPSASTVRVKSLTKKKRQCLQEKKEKKRWIACVWYQKYAFWHAYCGAGDEITEKNERRKIFFNF